jgi:hypothetical protein
LIYAKDFFELQLEFARSVSALSGLPLARTVLDYTNFYIRFGLGRGFDPAHPEWQAYLAGLRDGEDGQEWTYRFYAARPRPVAPPRLIATFGCFSYAWLGSDRLRLHFHDADEDGRSPLAPDRHDRRRSELAALFASAKRSAGHSFRVIGASWLYNTAAYRRLFPPGYLATAHVIHGRFRHMPLWGQFVRRDGNVRKDVAREFRGRLRRQTSLHDLDVCFPLQVLALEAPASDFYAFYDI